MNRYPVLNSRIPAEGRTITIAERMRLRARGIKVPMRAHIAQAQGCDYIGSVYRYTATGLSDTGVSVTLAGG